MHVYITFATVYFNLNKCEMMRFLAAFAVFWEKLCITTTNVNNVEIESTMMITMSSSDTVQGA